MKIEFDPLNDDDLYELIRLLSDRIMIYDTKKEKYRIISDFMVDDTIIYIKLGEDIGEDNG